MSCNLAVIGTSHVCDDHSNEDQLRYNSLASDSWPYYLAKQAGFDQGFNLGLTGFGIDTYFTRVESMLDNYDVDTVLLEIPCYGRNHLMLNEEQYQFNDYLNKEWVDHSGQDLIRNYMINFGGADNLKHPRTRAKIDRFNKKLSSGNKLPYYLFENFFELAVSFNYKLEDDMIRIKCKTLDSYLKSKGINTVWFNFDGSRRFVDDKEISQKILGGRRLIDHVEQQYGWNIKNKDDYADGIHLNSKKWRTLVDDHFLDILTRKDK